MDPKEAVERCEEIAFFAHAEGANDSHKEQDAQALDSLLAQHKAAVEALKECMSSCGCIEDAGPCANCDRMEAALLTCGEE